MDSAQNMVSQPRLKTQVCIAIYKWLVTLLPRGLRSSLSCLPCSLPSSRSSSRKRSWPRADVPACAKARETAKTLTQDQASAVLALVTTQAGRRVATKTLCPCAIELLDGARPPAPVVARTSSRVYCQLGGVAAPVP